jgi:hypothetical protein
MFKGLLGFAIGFTSTDAVSGGGGGGGDGGNEGSGGLGGQGGLGDLEVLHSLLLIPWLASHHSYLQYLH